VWTEPLGCCSDGFSNWSSFESLHDRRQGAGHADRNDVAGLADRTRSVRRGAIESGRARARRRKFLEAIHYFTVHSITRRALPKAIWKTGTAYGSGSGGSAGPVYSRHSFRCPQNAARRRILRSSSTARRLRSCLGRQCNRGQQRQAWAAHVAPSRPKYTSRPIPTVVLLTST
jgi:hypothetical protein